jgi:hypothetical protein
MVYQIGSETTVFTATTATPPEPLVVSVPADSAFAILWSTLGDTFSTKGELFSQTGAAVAPLAFPTAGTPNPTIIAVESGDLVAAQEMSVVVGSPPIFLIENEINESTGPSGFFTIASPTTDTLSGVALSNGIAFAASYYDQSATGTAVKLAFGGSFPLSTITVATANVVTTLPTQVIQLTGGGNYVVEWDDSNGFQLAAVSAAGTVDQSFFTTINTQVGEAAIAPTLNGNMAFAQSNNGAIEFGIFSVNPFNPVAAFNFVSTPAAITSPGQGENDLAPVMATLTNDDFVVAWYNGLSGQIEAQLLSPTGALIGSPFQINTNTSGVTPNLSVAGLSNGGFVITWSDDSGLTAKIEDQVFSLTPPTVAFPLANNSDITEAVYIGYFGRAGDPSGDAYWVGNLNNGTISISGMTASFSVQPEAQQNYPFLATQAPGSPETITSGNGWSLSVPTNIYNFINSVYEDLFNRSITADSSNAGLSYWSSQLLTNAGNPQAVANFILNVIGGTSGADQTTLVNKVTVADYFTQQMTADGFSFSSSADTIAHSAIGSVTSSASSVTAAEATINSFLVSQGL